MHGCVIHCQVSDRWRGQCRQYHNTRHNRINTPACYRPCHRPCLSSIAGFYTTQIRDHGKWSVCSPVTLLILHCSWYEYTMPWYWRGEEGREGFSNCGSRVLNWLESNSYRALLVKYFYDYWVPNSGRVIYGLEWKDEIFGWVNINKKKYLKSFTQSVTTYKFYNWLSI